MPSASDVVVTMLDLALHGRLPGDIVASLSRLLSGVAVGVGSGLLAGFIAGLNRPVATFLNPLVVFFNAISGIVWLPLVIGWLGIGSALAIFLIWNTVFFIVFQNTVLGVQLVPEVLEQGVRSLGGGRWETIRSVMLPGALPYILTGVRSGHGIWLARADRGGTGGRDHGTGPADFQWGGVSSGGHHRRRLPADRRDRDGDGPLAAAADRAADGGALGARLRPGGAARAMLRRLRAAADWTRLWC